MTYSIWLTWLLRLITAFVVVTVQIKDHIYYSSEPESNIKNILFKMKPLFREVSNKGM